jgi:hypothetical protein
VWPFLALASVAPAAAQPPVTVRVSVESEDVRNALGARGERIAQQVTDNIVRLGAARFGYLDWRSAGAAPSRRGDVELVARVFEWGGLRCRPRRILVEVGTSLQPAAISVQEVLSEECQRSPSWQSNPSLFASELVATTEKLAKESFDRLQELVEDNVSLVGDLELQRRIEASAAGVFLLVPASRLKAARGSELEVGFVSAAAGGGNRQGYFWMRPLGPAGGRTECEVGKFGFPSPPGNPAVEGWIRTHEWLVELLRPASLRDLTVLMKVYRPLLLAGQLSPKGTVTGRPTEAPR